MVVTSLSAHLLFAHCLPTRLDSLCFALFWLMCLWTLLMVLPLPGGRSYTAGLNFIQIYPQMPLHKKPLLTALFSFPHSTNNHWPFPKKSVKCCQSCPKGCKLAPWSTEFVDFVCLVHQCLLELWTMSGVYYVLNKWWLNKWINEWINI